MNTQETNNVVEVRPEKTAINTENKKVNKIIKDDEHKSQVKECLIIFILSFFLGMFGVDKFYKKQIILGIFKILTFAGLGIWYFIDWVLELVHLIRAL